MTSNVTAAPRSSKGTGPTGLCALTALGTAAGFGVSHGLGTAVRQAHER